MPEVFKLQSPSTGKVVQIEADSPEMAFDILDEIEAGQMGGATAALGLPNAAPALDMGKRFISGVGRALNPMNLIQAGADVAGSQLDALSQGDLTGLIPFAPMGRRMAQASADRLGEAARLAVDEGDLLGAAGQAGAAIPVVGEMAAGMGQRAAETGDYAGLAGELTGAALGPKVAGGMARRVIAPVTRVGGKAIQAAPRAGKIAWEMSKELNPAVSAYRKAKRTVDRATKAVDKSVPKAKPVETAPEPAPTAPNPPAKPSSVPQTARDVDSALKSLDKASQARLKHVVKQAQKEGADIKPGSYAATGSAPWKMTQAEWKASHAVDPKLIDIAERVSDITRGKRPSPSPGEMRELVKAGLAKESVDPGFRGTATYLTDEGKNLALGHRKAVVAAIRNGDDVPESVLASYPDLKSLVTTKASTYADDAAASAARQKQHIADSYAKKEAKDAANVKRSESLIPDLEQSAELLKKYPKRGGETNSQWMQRVTKKINEEKSSPSAAQEIANDLAGRIQELSVNQGMSRAQIKSVLEQNHGIPSKYSSQMVNMVLGKKGK